MTVTSPTAVAFTCAGCGATRSGAPTPSGLCQVCATRRSPRR